MYKKFDLIFGFIVIAIFLWFLFVLLSSVFDFKAKYYKLNASFNSVEGILKGADVKISGVKVGSVIDVSVDKKTLGAKVVMQINADFKLPTDTLASIQSSGLLGGKHISLVPGFEEDNLKNGDKIERTESSLNLEGLISKFAGSTSKDK